MAHGGRGAAPNLHVRSSIAAELALQAWWRWAGMLSVGQVGRAELAAGWDGGGQLGQLQPSSPQAWAYQQPASQDELEVARTLSGDAVGVQFAAPAERTHPPDPAPGGLPQAALYRTAPPHMGTMTAPLQERPDMETVLAQASSSSEWLAALTGAASSSAAAAAAPAGARLPAALPAYSRPRTAPAGGVRTHPGLESNGRAHKRARPAHTQAPPAAALSERRMPRCAALLLRLWSLRGHYVAGDGSHKVPDAAGQGRAKAHVPCLDKLRQTSTITPLDQLACG